MNILQQFLETCEYRITEGSEYTWECYGNRSYCLDSWDGRQDGHSFTVIFDRDDQTVYELQAHDYLNQRCYRWFDPEYKDAFFEDAKQRNSDPKAAWDDLVYVDLEVVEDFFEKMSAIYNGKDYDTRVSIPVDFTDEELLKYMKLAHEKDMTFNQFVEEAMRAAIDEFNRDPDAFRDRAEQFIKQS